MQLFAACTSPRAEERDAVRDGLERPEEQQAVPVDVQVYTRAEFETRAALAVSFERTVKHKGRVVYAA